MQQIICKTGCIQSVGGAIDSTAAQYTITAHVKLLILCGATADKIRAAVEQAPDYRPGCPEILDVTPFTAAVETARDHACPGDVVTLSPACAAFDQFKNFAERGKFFKSIVNGWQE